jgi:predicted GIY-YIG superfamily endonuclease
MRDTYKYRFTKGRKTVHVGITNDLERREREHKAKYGEDGHIRQEGRATTRLAALEWEREQAKKGRPTRRRRK